jgi:hypothetical protein
MMRTGLVLLAAAAAWLGPIAPARADCVSDCQASTYCDAEMTESGECSSRLNACYAQECNRTHYGAIAYGAESGAWGYAYDRYDSAAAESDALANCRPHGDDCQVVVDFWNTCAAVAAGGGKVAWGLGENRTLAENNALASCVQNGGTDCAVQVWSCSKP